MLKRFHYAHVRVFKGGVLPNKNDMDALIQSFLAGRLSDAVDTRSSKGANSYLPLCQRPPSCSEILTSDL